MKKHHAEEHFNAEAWLLPYADMITLMLAFFIIMYALNLDSGSKVQEFAQSVRIALGLPQMVQPGGKVPPMPGKSTDGKYKPSKSGVPTPGDTKDDKNFQIDGSTMLTVEDLQRMGVSIKELKAAAEAAAAAEKGQKPEGDKGEKSTPKPGEGAEGQQGDNNGGQSTEGQKIAGAAKIGEQTGGKTQTPETKDGGKTTVGKDGAEGKNKGDESGAHGRTGENTGGFSNAPEEKIGGRSIVGVFGATGTSVGKERGGPEQHSGKGLSERGDQGAKGLVSGIDTGGKSVDGDVGAQGLSAGVATGGVDTTGRQGAKGNIGEKLSGAAEMGKRIGGKTVHAGEDMGGRKNTASGGTEKGTTKGLTTEDQGRQGKQGQDDGGHGKTGKQTAGQSTDGEKTAGQSDQGKKTAGQATTGEQQGGETLETQTGQRGQDGANSGGFSTSQADQQGGSKQEKGQSTSISKDLAAKNEKIIEELKKKLGGVELPTNSRERLLTLLWALEEQNHEKFQKGEMEISITDRGLEISFRRNLLFEFGTAQLTQSAKKMLSELSVILASFPEQNDLRVEGHTDSWPVSSFLYPSNWELSTARATAVVRYLVEYENLNPSRFAAAGYGQHRPLDTNSTPEGRSNNRRVDVVILNAGNMMEIPSLKEELIPNKSQD